MILKSMLKSTAGKCFLSAAVMLSAYASGAVGQTPVLRHVFDIRARCGDARVVGNIPGGKRVMIPITGGNVEGTVEAEILPGGADYQLVDTVSGRVEFNAIYTLRTGDGHLVNVRNTGVSTSGTKGDYFTTSPAFEAPQDSGLDWLNNRIFICRPIGFGDGIVHLRVWLAE